MTDPIDFPPATFIGQTYTAPFGTTYIWDGLSWGIAEAEQPTQTLDTIGEILNQIRVLLQDTTVAYRYTTDSIITNINMGMWEMYRVRPDVFLETSFAVPQFSSFELDTEWPIEEQWMPAIIYYAVGMTQVRDDEGTQDTRAAAFLQKFQQILLAPL